MNNDKKNAVTAGVLLLAAIVTGVVGMSQILPITSGPDVLGNIAAQPTRYVIGQFLFILMAFCCTGIAVWLYPALKQHNSAMAAGALAFRTIEGGIFIIQAAANMGLAALVVQMSSADGALAMNYQLAGEVLMSVVEMIGAVGGALAFCFGAFLYYTIMVQSRLVPRWLSIWGLVAIIAHTVEVVMVIFGGSSTSTLALIMNMPIFFNELALAGWLIFKGFNFSHMKSVQVSK